MRLYEKYLKLYLNFLIFFIPLVFIRKCEDAYYLPKLVLLLTALQFGPALRKVKYDKIDITLWLFIVFYALSCLKTINALTTVYWLLSMVSVVDVFMYVRHCLSETDRRKAFVLIVSSALFACFYAVAQVFKLDMKGWITDFAGRVFSSMGNPDFFGGFLILAIPASISVYYLFGKKNLSAVIFVFLTATLFLSQTRSSLFAFFAAAYIDDILF